MRWILLFLLVVGQLSAQDPILFLTWKKDPLHTMTAIWITEDPSYHGLIQWRLCGEEQFKQKAAIKTLVTFDKKKFYHFQSELTFLKPDRVYEFKIEGMDQLHKFKSAPANLDNPVKFIVGGDVYHDEVASMTKMMGAAAQFNPLFCVLGGDLAYFFASKKSGEEDIGRWFTLLSSYGNEMVTPDGLMIPLIPVLGNHDIRGGYLAGVRNAKFFFTVFPTPGNLGYNTLDFGKWLTLFLLDSGHANPVSGSQTTWLQKTLQEKIDVPYIFAIYHVGAYPSYRAFHGKRPQELRKCWTPLFDRYGITAAFEHHDHTLKRTIPIKENLPKEDGVIYLGDGSFGTGSPRKPHTPEAIWYLAYTAQVQAVWGVVLDKKEADFYALSVDGKTLDSTKKSSRKSFCKETPN